MKTHLLVSAAVAAVLLIGGAASASQPVYALKQVAELDAAPSALAAFDESDALVLQDKASSDLKTTAKDKRKIAKDEKTLELNAQNLIGEAKLSGNRDSVADTEKLLTVDRDILKKALSTGDGDDILKAETVVIAGQDKLQAHLLPEDRRVVLEDQKVSPKDEFAVGVLPQFGLANAFPTEVDQLKYWVDASQSVKTVDFYSLSGELFDVAPDNVIESYKDLESIGGGKAPEDEVLKKAFSVSNELYEKFGEAGLFGELVYLEDQKKFPGEKADILALDKRILASGKPIIGPTGGGGIAAVPEPGVWSMLLVGFGVLGATLRRRRFAVAA